jgi:putative PIN family toxin of toxin-antitoxin system
MEKDRVVIDTTVWLHGIHKGKHEKFVKLAVDAGVVIYTCDELSSEVIKNLRTNPYFKKHISAPQEHIDFFEAITLHTTIDKRFDRAADIKDNYLFDLAYTTKSFYVVTSEYKLLNMKRVNKMNIISPTAFFALFNIKW